LNFNNKETLLCEIEFFDDYIKVGLGLLVDSLSNNAGFQVGSDKSVLTVCLVCDAHDESTASCVSEACSCFGKVIHRVGS